MADVDEKEKAEKLAAAKKRFEQLKKQKGKGAKAGAGKKADSKPAEKKQDASKEETSAPDPKDANSDVAQEKVQDDKAEEQDKVNQDAGVDGIEQLDDAKPSHHRQPSLSLQSKMRSASFRRASQSQGPLSPSANGAKSPELTAASPDGESVNSIYRKQAARLDELERENKKLAQEAQDAGKKLKRTEEELDELRDASGDVAALKSKSQKLEAQTEEVGKLRSENASLQRQVSQLQSQSSKRHVSSSSTANSTSPAASLQAELDSKSSTIESMELEISNLRAQANKSADSTSSHSEQIAALEEKADRAERAAGHAQRELSDVKKNLDRASDKALREGTDKISAETRIRTLMRDLEQSKTANQETLKRADNLEKKLHAITNVNKDADSRRQASERERERLEKESIKFHRRLASLENENLQMREERKKNKMRHVAGGTDDDGLDELENSEKLRLEHKIRDLESEVFELRRGVWRDRRRSIQPNMDGDTAVVSPSGKFDDVDLNGPSPYFRTEQNARGSSFSNVLTSGLNAFTGGGGGHKADDHDLDEDAFDEDAFRVAQQEDAMKRIERVKEIKRGLKDWEGWRMDIVDFRRVAGGGMGEIFEV